MKTVLVMDRDQPHCWAIMPVVAERVRRFSAEHEIAGGDQLLAKAAMTAFGAGVPEFLTIAVLDGDKPTIGEAVVGHVVAGVESLLGKNVAMVYQFEKSGGGDSEWQEVNTQINTLVELWARRLGLDEILAMAQSDSRARLFGYYGYERGPVLVRRKF